MHSHLAIARDGHRKGVGPDDGFVPTRWCDNRGRRGRAYGEQAPTKTFTDMFYADATLQAGAVLPLPDDHEDRGIYVVDGSIEVAGDTFDAGRMMVFRPGDRLAVKAGERGARLMLLGGDTMSEGRHIWWNFVASSQEKIDAAKEAWREGDFTHGRFKLPAGDDAEYITIK